VIIVPPNIPAGGVITASRAMTRVLKRWLTVSASFGEANPRSRVSVTRCKQPV
jgi:hypothetical protein